MQKRILIFIMFILIVVLFILGLSSCKGDAQDVSKQGDFELELLFEKDGCKMYRFYDSKWVYWSTCEGSTQYSEYQTTGKSGYTKTVQTLTNKK